MRRQLILLHASMPNLRVHHMRDKGVSVSLLYGTVAFTGLYQIYPQKAILWSNPALVSRRQDVSCIEERH